jgi:3'-phosphoadenosine 5'-phosphosulfate sulfotransferase (PAPS reductase)/FAD synthetase
MNQITEEDMIRSIFNIGDGVDEIPAYYLENESVIFHLGISGGKDSAAAFFKLIYESDIDPKRIICTMSDTKNEDPLTMAFVSLMAKHHPIQIIESEGFFNLCRRKGLFPSRKRQFCTEELKIKLTAQYLEELGELSEYVACSGSRLEEGKSHNQRGIFPNFELHSPYWNAPVYRPCNTWSIGEVWAISQRYIRLDEVISIVEADPTLRHKDELIDRIRGNGIPRNPLYDMGARRVGCLPCINSVKAEMRAIAYYRPGRISEIALWEDTLSEETGNAKSFFHRNTVPEQHRTVPWVNPETGETLMVCSVNDVAQWSHTAYGGKQYAMFPDESIDDRYRVCKTTGLCE